MTDVLIAAQMRAQEQAAIDSGNVTGLVLMERAGEGVVAAVFETWPGLAKGNHTAQVLCGPGNNGGDGFVVARLLADRGWQVEVALFGDASKLPADARENFQRWTKMGRVAPMSDEWNEDAPDLVVDAVFGTGLKRLVPAAVSGAMTRVQDAIAAEKSPHFCRRVAVDIPSGICSDSGRILGSALRCDLTATFHRPKPGHFLGDGPMYCGQLDVRDIGLPDLERPSAPRLSAAAAVSQIGEPDLSDLEKAGNQSHKFTHGHALVMCGLPGRGGAARLAARGALRIGAGLVTIGCPPAALSENAAQLNAIMVRAVDGQAGLVRLLEDKRYCALCLGPGLGLGEATRGLVETALQSGRPCVLDADALSIYHQKEDQLFAALHSDVVLTPHMGEFARLFPDLAGKLADPAVIGPAFSKVDATCAAAARAGCVVLLKGPDTIIAHPDGRCAIHSAHYNRAAPWLATAGSGDVLAGFITGLLARGFAPMQAAKTAAWLHVECARSFGPGLIAEDLPEELPRVFGALEH